MSDATQELNELILSFQKIAGPEFKEEILEALGALGLTLIQEEFETEKDPYGTSWAALKIPRRFGGGILDASGRMRNAFGFEIGNNEIRFYNPTEYSSYHQEGTIKMERRSMLPVGNIPDEWAEKIKKTVEEAMLEQFNG